MTRYLLVPYPLSAAAAALAAREAAVVAPLVNLAGDAAFVPVPEDTPDAVLPAGMWAYIAAHRTDWPQGDNDADQ